MSDENLEDTYPHWKDALFGNHNAVANLRCAVHYVFWHGLYGLLAVIGVLVVGAIKGGMFVAQYLGPLAGPTERALDAVFSRVSYVINHDYTEKIAGGALIVVFVGTIVFVVGGLLYHLYTHFWITLGIIGASIGIMAGLLASVLLVDYLIDPAKSAASGVALSARAAGERAVKTPGVRRVYGECPVSMEQAPHWFENLFPEEDL